LGGIWHGGGLAFWRTEINGFEISKLETRLSPWRAGGGPSFG
jgi:hypothetical protein